MRHKNNFNALRLLGALLVLFSHQFALAGRWEPRFLGDHSFGNLGVLIFFSISGYLVSSSWYRDPHPIRFLIRRTLRVIPGLFVSVILTYVFVLSLGLIGFPGNPLPNLNGSLWTIPIEIYCYFLLFGMAILFSRSSLPFFSGMLITWLLCNAGLLHGEFLYLAYFGLFFGMGSLLDQYPVLRSQHTIVFFFLTGLFFIYFNQTVLGLTLIVPPITVNIGSRSWPFIKHVGRYCDLSYGIYIYAWPIQQLFIHWIGKNSDYVILLAPSLITTLAMAYISWHLIEYPSLKIKTCISGYKAINLRQKN